MTIKFNILSPDKIGELYSHVLLFLSERGVNVQHRGVLTALDGAGALVDLDTETVRFPKGLVEEALMLAPRSCMLASVESHNDLNLPSREKSFHVCTGTGAMGILDPENGTYRKVSIQDVKWWGQLVNTLSNIDMCAFPTPTDAPPETVDVHSLDALLQSTSKHVWIQPHTQESLPYLIELAVARAEGTERFKSRPVASMICCALTPFQFKSMDMEVILQACRHGMPIHASSLPVIGGTSPITALGTVVVAGIEVLAMLVIAQIIRPGIPVIGLATSLLMDMLSGRAVKASVEAMQVNAASAQFMREVYKIPTHTAGLTTDTVVADGQAMVEHSLFGLMVASAGADILGRAGELEAAKTISPLQLIVDNEVAGMVRRLCSGIELNDEALAWGDILATPPGGHFLETDHTLKHCRDAFQPQLFMRQARDTWQSLGGKELPVRTQELYQELMRCAELPPVSDNIREEMDRIVREADRALAQ